MTQAHSQPDDLVQSKPRQAQQGLPLGELLNRNPELAGHLCRHDLLRTLLRRSLVASAVQNVKVPEEASAKLLEAYWQRQGIDTEEDRRQHLQDRLIRPEDLRWQLELKPRIQAFAEKQFGAKAEAHFLKRKNQLDQVTYRMIRLKDQFLAREIYLQLLEGEEQFSALIQRYGEAAERASNGLVGPVTLGKTHPLLAERLRGAAPGELLEPIPTGQAWVVLRLEHSHPASFDEAMARRMAVELFQQWIEEQLRDRINQMQSQPAPSPRP